MRTQIYIAQTIHALLSYILQIHKIISFVSFPLLQSTLPLMLVILACDSFDFIISIINTHPHSTWTRFLLSLQFTDVSTGHRWRALFSIVLTTVSKPPNLLSVRLTDAPSPCVAYSGQ